MGGPPNVCYICMTKVYVRCKQCLLSTHSPNIKCTLYIARESKFNSNRRITLDSIAASLFVLNWLSWQIVSDGKIQITILELRRGALSRSLTHGCVWEDVCRGEDQLEEDYPQDGGHEHSLLVRWLRPGPHVGYASNSQCFFWRKIWNFQITLPAREPTHNWILATQRFRKI